MSKRLSYLDYIRVVACMMVVAIHVSAEYMFISQEWSMVFNIAFLVDKMSRIAVPLFFMISGKLYLSKEKFDFKVFLRKTWFPLLGMYILWNLLYAIRRGYSSFGVLLQEGSFHLWFIPVILGIYLLLPILRSLNEELLKWLLLITFVTEILLTTLRLTLPYFGIVTQIASMQYCSYLFYFLLGYFLDMKKGNILYGVLWLLSNICFGCLSIYVFHNIGIFFEYNHLVVCFEACCFYLMMNGICTKRSLSIERLGSLTLNIYFCHMFFVYLFKAYGFIQKYNMIVVYSMVLIFSAVVSLIINQIVRLCKGGKKDFMLSR